MAQNNNFKNSVILVNSNLIGVLDRTNPNRAAGGAKLNYALRPNWGIADRLRGVLGAYYAISSGGTDSDPKLVNLGQGSADLSTLAIARQVESIPLILSQLPANNGIIKYLIELDNAAWNALAFEDSSLNLLRQAIEEAGVSEGDPMWEYFLKSGIPGAELADPPLPTGIPPVFDTTQIFSDLTSFFYRASNDDTIREKSGLTVKIEPVYNFYVDTTPPYETISLQASEPMLPSFYCLESEIRNTGSTFNSADYFNQITLDGKLQEVNIDNDADPDPWFQQVAGPAGGFDESTTVQFYTLYSKGLNILKNNSQVDGLKTAFNEKYKNMVILNSDLPAMSEFVIRDDETSGLRNISFYNKITIGRDEDNVSDPSELFNGSSFFSLMMDDPDFESSHSFMDILQLYIIQNILGHSSEASSFKTQKLTRGSSTDPTTHSISVEDASVSLYFDMSTFLDDIVNEFRIQQIITRINTNTTTDDNFILIRNYNSEAGLVAATNVATDNFLLLNQDDRLNYPVRDFDKILANKAAYSEPIMYQIDKYALPASVDVPAAGATPVQTIFIGKSFENKEINYIDSQVKYGVRYYYDIKQIRMIFGTKYSYKDLKVFFRDAPGYGRAVGNALGFYREPRTEYLLDDYVTEYIKEYRATDQNSSESQVTMDGAGNEVSALSGYYIFKAANFNAFMAGPERERFEVLFATGTGYVHKNPMLGNSTAADRSVLEDIYMNITEGFGLEGNSTGGADSGILMSTISATAGVGPTAPGPTGETPGETSEPMVDATGATYAGSPDYGTPVKGTADISIQGKYQIDPDLLDLWSGN